VTGDRSAANAKKISNTGLEMGPTPHFTPDPPAVLVAPTMPITLDKRKIPGHPPLAQSSNRRPLAGSVGLHIKDTALPQYAEARAINSP
jgi:hypothetical protein